MTYYSQRRAVRPVVKGFLIILPLLVVGLFILVGASLRKPYWLAYLLASMFLGGFGVGFTQLIMRYRRYRKDATGSHT